VASVDHALALQPGHLGLRQQGSGCPPRRVLRLQWSLNGRLGNGPPRCVHSAIKYGSYVYSYCVLFTSTGTGNQSIHRYGTLLAMAMCWLASAFSRFRAQGRTGYLEDSTCTPMRAFLFASCTSGVNCKSGAHVQGIKAHRMNGI
jgi:hypothetical protein